MERKTISFTVKAAPRPGAPLKESDRFQVMDDLALLARRRLLGEVEPPPELLAAMRDRWASMEIYRPE